MATDKPSGLGADAPAARRAKAKAPPTHPTVWVGLALAVGGLLVATYAYTGARVYEVAFAFVALGGAIMALAGILVAAWGRSIMAARASRSRRAVFKDDALALGRPVPVTQAVTQPSSEDAPTVAVSREKKRFSFPLPKRNKSSPTSRTDERSGASGAGVFAFKRRQGSTDPAQAQTAEAPPAQAQQAPLPPIDAELDAIGDLGEPRIVRVTLKCPSCATTFSAEGIRPFQASCTQCGFSATV